MKMPTQDRNQSWLQELPGERARIVRICARLSGSFDAADDLAQETLFEAWRQAGNLRDEGAWRAFVTGIARNVCLRWRRERGKESVFRAVDTERNGVDAYSVLLDTTIADPTDLEVSLEQEEIAELLGKALAQLPSSSRELLFERYIDDLPPNEMAERRGLSDNVLGVRLHRARLSLQKLLATPAFREDAASYGLISAESADGWQETRLWCPRCGKRRLQGRFCIPEDTDTVNTLYAPAFAVRCPDCEGALGIDFTSGHPALSLERVLGEVRGFKPALNRLSGWWGDYYSNGLKKGYLACPFCGRQASVTTSPPLSTHPVLVAMRGVYVHCRFCGPPVCVSFSGIAYHSPGVQQFWKEHPRMALGSEQDVRYSGQDAVAVTFRSLLDTGSVQVILSRSNFQTLHVSNNKVRKQANKPEGSDEV